MKIVWSKWILSVCMFIFSLLMLLPVLMMVATSFKSSLEVNSPQLHLLPSHFHWENYRKAMSTGDWGRYFLNSSFVTLTVTLGCLFFNSMAGFAFARLDFRLKSVLFSSILLGIMIPPQITMVPIFIIMKHIPLAGGNDLFGMGGTGWVNTYPGLMVNHLAGAFGIFLCRQYYAAFPRELGEAAELDGCSSWNMYARVYLPLSKPILASLAVLKISATWNDYVWPLVITNSEQMRTIQLALTVFRNENVHWELLMAATTVATLPLIVLFLSAQRFFAKGMLTSGIK